MKREHSMKKTLRTLTFLLPLYASLFNANAQIVHVAPGGTGDGSAWAQAAGDLRAVLDAATPGTEVWVKAGTYKPVNCNGCTFSQRNLHFEVKNGVKLYGGFAGSETSADQRNIAANPTILSGDIDGDGQLANNSFTVVYTHNVGELTVVDGFIITGGNADNNAFALGTPQNSGGGWYNAGSTPGSSSRPVVRNCRFEGNYAWGYGGGMYNDGSFGGDCRPSLEHCAFIENTARSGGGGMSNTGSFGGLCAPVLTDCHFEKNKSLFSDGGGMANAGNEGGTCSPALTACAFLENVAFGNGGAIFNSGRGGNSSPALHACVFDNNSAAAGGAVYNDGTFSGMGNGAFSDCHFTNNHSDNGDGGAMYNAGYLGTCNPELVNSTFENNHSSFAGAAIFNNGVEGTCSPTLTNCRFLGNNAGTYAGAIYNQGKSGHASPTITNCLFSSNTALSAGAVYNLGSEGGHADALITNCTFYGNQANVGGAIYCNAGEQGTGSAAPQVRNCIFWGNLAGDGKVFRIIWGTPLITYSLADVPDCQAFYSGMGGAVNCGEGLVFDQNPQFEAPAGGNFRLLPGSPAIDQGDNEAIVQTGVLVDLDNLPRIHNNTVDMGVFEYGSTAGTAPVIVQNPAGKEVCEGAEAVFSISATGGQPLTYQWYKDGEMLPAGTQSVLIISQAAPSDAGNYHCAVSNAGGETTNSAVAALSVKTPIEVGLTITANQTEICEGEEITITAHPVNGGAAPVFQWFINGNAFGSSIPAFSISQLSNGDSFACALTSSETCTLDPTAFSNTLTIYVENVLTASLSVVAHAPTACEGQPLELTAQPVNGGSSPVFQWTLNGNPVGSNSPSLILPAPQNGDQVQCTMTSSKTCVVVNPVHSEPVTVAVEPLSEVGIAITASVDTVICKGTAVVFTATAENGGTAPVFEWRINGLPVGENQAIFTTDQLEDGDQVTCLLTSDVACLVENPVLSGEITVSVAECTVAIEPQPFENQVVLVYPNPTSGKIFVEISESTGIFALNLLNTQGQIALSTFENHPVVPCFRELNITGFPKGIYYLQIITDRYLTVKKIVLE